MFSRANAKYRIAVPTLLLLKSTIDPLTPLFCTVPAGTLERAGGQGVDHAVGAVLGPQVVPIAHRLAQVLRVAFNTDRHARPNDARQTAAELHVRAHIVRLVRSRTVQVNIIYFS